MKKFGFFNNLDEKDKKYLIDNSKYIEVPKNSILFYQGDICKDILLLEDGKVKLSIYGNIDEVVSLYEISEGEQCIINTSSTLSQTQAIATAQTLTDIKGWLVPQKVSKELMIKSEAYQNYIFSLFSLKFNTLTTLIEDIKFKRLDTRILEYLQNKNSLFIEITHEQIANDLDTSRVVISRVLKELENKKFLKLHRGKIELL